MENKEICQPCADELNQLVQNRIDKALWIICNYEPSQDVPIGYDGKSYQKMLEMYIFAIDVGLCGKINKLVKWDAYKQDGLKNLLKDIGRRRSVIGHNQSRENGNEEDQEWYEKWMKKIIGSKHPQTEKEWKAVYGNLEIEERKLISDLEALINAVFCMGEEEKKDVVLGWKEIIEKWYRSNAGRKAIIGQWKKLYKAHNPKEKISYPWYSLNMYVKNTLHSDIDDIEELLKRESLLSEANIQKLASMKESVAKKIKEDLEQNGLKVTEYKDDELYAEWYISSVQHTIGEFCINTIPSGVVSLLPQDAIEYICDEIDKKMRKLFIEELANQEKTKAVDNTSGDIDLNEKEEEEKLNVDINRECVLINDSIIPEIPYGEMVDFYPLEFKPKVVRGVVKGTMASVNKASLDDITKGKVYKALKEQKPIKARIKSLNPQKSGYIVELVEL